MNKCCSFSWQSERRMVKFIWLIGLAVLSLQVTSSWKYDRRKLWMFICDKSDLWRSVFVSHLNRHINIFIDMKKFVMLNELIDVINLSCPPPRPQLHVFYRRKRDSQITFGLIILFYFFKTSSFANLNFLDIFWRTTPISLATL